MANALSAIGWLIGRMVGVALLPVSLLVFFVLGYAFVIGKPFGLDPYLTKPYGVLMMAVGAYWLWLGTRLVRGRLAVTFDPRRFVAGNLGLLFACLALLTGVAAGSRDEVPADAAALPFAAGALWLWTAVRLLKVDGAPAAGLGRFAAGNVLIAAALACAFLSAGIHEVGGLPGPSAIVLAAGLALLAIAAWLLRVATPRQLRAAGAAQESPEPQRSAGAAEEESAPAEASWRKRRASGFLNVLGNMFFWLITTSENRREIEEDLLARGLKKMRRGKADAEEKKPEQQDSAAAKNASWDFSLSRDNRRVAGLLGVLLGLGLWVKGAVILFVAFFMQDVGEVAFSILDPDNIVSPPVWAGLSIVLGPFGFWRGLQFARGKRNKTSRGDLVIALAGLFIIVYVPVPLP